MYNKVTVKTYQSVMKAGENQWNGLDGLDTRERKR